MWFVENFLLTKRCHTPCAVFILPKVTLALCHMYLCVDHYWGQVIYILLPNTKNSQMLWPTANTPYQFASSHCATKSIASLSNWQLMAWNHQNLKEGNLPLQTSPQILQTSCLDMLWDNMVTMHWQLSVYHLTIPWPDLQRSHYGYQASCPCFFMSSCSEGYSIHCVLTRALPRLKLLLKDGNLATHFRSLRLKLQDNPEQWSKNNLAETNSQTQTKRNPLGSSISLTG
jgi:hypothetical protein